MIRAAIVALARSLPDRWCWRRRSSPPASCSDPKAPGARKSLQVFAAASLEAAFREIGEAFTAANPNEIAVFQFAGSTTLVSQIQNGAAADVFASADEAEHGAPRRRAVRRRRPRGLRAQPPRDRRRPRESQEYRRARGSGARGCVRAPSALPRSPWGAMPSKSSSGRGSKSRRSRSRRASAASSGKLGSTRSTPGSSTRPT